MTAGVQHEEVSGTTLIADNNRAKHPPPSRQVLYLQRFISYRGFGWVYLCWSDETRNCKGYCKDTFFTFCWFILFYCTLYWFLQYTGNAGSHTTTQFGGLNHCMLVLSELQQVAQGSSHCL